MSKSNWWDKIIQAIKDLFKPKPKPDPASDLLAAEKASGLDLATAEPKTKNTKNAKITLKGLTLTCNEDSMLGMTYESSVNKFPYYDGACDGWICVAWKREGKTYTTYLDWKPVGAGYNWPEGFKNMYANDEHKPFAQKGDDCWFFVMSTDSAQRSSALKAANGWPVTQADMEALIAEDRKLEALARKETADRAKGLYAQPR
jgi:hypothetical protein